MKKLISTFLIKYPPDEMVLYGICGVLFVLISPLIIVVVLPFYLVGFIFKLLYDKSTSELVSYSAKFGPGK